jgi:hypothetical protein
LEIGAGAIPGSLCYGPRAWTATDVLRRYRDMDRIQSAGCLLDLTPKYRICFPCFPTSHRRELGPRRSGRQKNRAGRAVSKRLDKKMPGCQGRAKEQISNADLTWKLPSRQVRCSLRR